VRALLANGADPNAKEDDGWSALMWASARGHIEVADMLLQNGAEIDAIDKDGYTALMHASLKLHNKVVRLLVDKGANVNAEVRGGMTTGGTPLTMGTGLGPPDIVFDLVQALLDKGANVNAKRNDGFTALMAASSMDHVHLVQVLLSKGADINAKDNKGKTALDYAKKYGKGAALTEIISLLTRAETDQTQAPGATGTAGPPTIYETVKESNQSNGEPAAEYRDEKYGFSVQRPEGWTVAATEHVEGEWIKPVVLVRNEDGQRVAVCIISIGAMHKGGEISEYMSKARIDLSKSFQEFTLISSDEKMVNNLPTAWMHYRYVEQGQRNEEYNVTFFLGKRTGVPFQIVCFTDHNRFGRLKEEFMAMIRSLSFLNDRLWLPHISFYGASRMNCLNCAKTIGPEASVPFVKFPENELQVLCASCFQKLK
jgi:hypothetical protein